MYGWTHCHPERFDIEVRLMRKFTHATIEIHRGEIYWREDVKVRGLSQSYRLLIAYPPSFPERAPDCYIIRPVLAPDTPHLSVSGALSLRADPFNPDSGVTAAATRNRAIAWLLGYECWRRNGVWR